MPVYQPNSVVGNSRVLVALGRGGELMSFFYPHIDFCQNLHEGMPAVYFPARDGHPARLVWTFDPSWHANQSYLGRTNIAETHLTHMPTGLALTVTDFVHPSEPVLIRRFVAHNTARKPLRAKLFQYLDVQLGEVEHKNAVHLHSERNLAIAYWRNICFGIGGTEFDEFGCGRAGPHSRNSTKSQLESGRLNRQIEEIGDVDLAVGWNLSLSPDEIATKNLVIAADSNELAAAARVDGFRNLGWDAAMQWTEARWDEHVEKAQPVRLEEDLTDAYYRCILAIDLLADPDTGSILAAPEFDPFFERSGGYGYCWPRDAIEVCLAMEAAGYPEYLANFLSWAVRAQRPEGYWEQRYWLSGQRGPAWCTAADSIQIDQTASVLFAMGRHARALDERNRIAFLENIWESAHRAADYLTCSISPDRNLHSTAFDLWETFRGTFTYSNAAISAALREAAYLARNSAQDALADQWNELASVVKNAILTHLWQGDAFARGYDAAGQLDRTVDLSALGLITPFQVISLDDSEERDVATKAIHAIATRLSQPENSAETLLRFERDGYAGGGPSAVATLWFAQALLHLALAPGSTRDQVASYRTRAVASMRATLRSGTTTGLLPEMMGPAPGTHWAVPHAWAMAAFTNACHLLDQLPQNREARIR